VTSETVVAVVEKRGRFWAAEPHFPTLGSGERGRRSRAARRIVLASNRVDGPDGGTASAGELVLVRLPGRGGDGRARIVCAIGRPDVARDAIEALMLDRDLARGFDPAVLAAAQDARELGLAAAVREVDEGRRRDLRGLTTLTIDPASAKDYDDAISAELLDLGGGGGPGSGGPPAGAWGGDKSGERTRGGGGSPEGGGVSHGDTPGGEAADGGGSSEGMSGKGVRVWVHIADVSAYVPEGSPVDVQARRRGTSVYVPGAVEPMLPEALSNDACSLVPGAERAAVTVEMDLHGAQVVRSAFYRSLIRSDARLEYERVDRIFAGRERAEDPWAAPLAAARAASAALGGARERAGGLVLDSQEPEFVFDAGGHVSEIRMRAQTESHRLIEHLMIAANEAVARALSERGTPCLFRVHERPAPERVKRLIEQLASLGVPTPPVPESLSPSQAAELMGEVSRRVERHVQGALKRAGSAGSAGSGRGAKPAPDDEAQEGSGRARVGPWGGRIALTSLVLRSLQQAYYSPKNIGHAGLHAACYCHFTSPIRRYPDLVCHRALVSTLGGDEPGPRAGDLGELGEWTSEREREAMGIERGADDLARCFALEQALYEHGWEQTFAGEVTGLISAGAFVAFGVGAEPTYEGMLSVRRMRSEDGRDWWELNEQATILRGERSGATIRLGDPIEVRVARVDTIRGRVDLAPAE
jgi:ribonuclease R